MSSLGTDFFFSCRDGYFDYRGIFFPEILPGKKYTHTIWLSNCECDMKAERIIGDGLPN